MCQQFELDEVSVFRLEKTNEKTQIIVTPDDNIRH